MAVLIFGLAMISILASIALPMYGEYKRRAHAVNASQQMQQIGTVLVAKHQETGSFPAIEDTATLETVTGVKVNPVNTYTYDELPGVMQLRVDFSEKMGFPADCYIDLIVDCSADDCETILRHSQTLLESGHYGDFLVDQPSNE
jgi:Tfp pilus assembly major pilin PilA